MAKKQPSSRVSTLAAKLVSRLSGAKPRAVVGYGDGFFIVPFATVRELRSALMSLISQDEAPGNAKPKKRAKKKGRR